MNFTLFPVLIFPWLSFLLALYLYCQLRYGKLLILDGYIFLRKVEVDRLRSFIPHLPENQKGDPRQQPSL